MADSVSSMIIQDAGPVAQQAATETQIHKDLLDLGKQFKGFSRNTEGLAGTLEHISDIKKDLAEGNRIQQDLAQQKAEAEAKGDYELADIIGAEMAANEDRQQDLQKELNESNNKAEEQRAQQRKDNEERLFSNLGNAVMKALNQLKKSAESAMEVFISSQQAMAYSIYGLEKTGVWGLHKLTDDINDAFAGSGIVKQETFYNKLGELMQSGIVYNAEQRAYLQTISDDLNMGFSTQSSALTRLVTIYGEDITSNRMAIQDSLKEFLNQNYMTSQYIKQGFEEVSSALLEAQAWMSKENAIELEKTLQTWLGSLSSVGVSSGTVTNIAQAINELGSGNISSLSGNKLQNLIILGANRASLDYAEMLTNGVSSEFANSLMSGITSYLQEVATRESNVVKSAYTDILGITMSDLRAVANMVEDFDAAATSVTDNIYYTLTKAGGATYKTTQISNMLSNLYWQVGSGIASSEVEYLLYKGIDMISEQVGDIMEGFDISAAWWGLGGKIDPTMIAKMIPLATLLGMGGSDIIQGLFGAMGNLGSSVAQDAINVYNSLGFLYGANTTTMRGTATGDILGLTSLGASNSASMTFSNAGADEGLQQAKTSGDESNSKVYKEDESEKSEKSFDDLYEAVAGDGSNTNVLALMAQMYNLMADLPNHAFEITSDYKFASVSIGGLAATTTDFNTGGTVGSAVAGEKNPLDGILTYSVLSFTRLDSILALLQFKLMNVGGPTTAFSEGYKYNENVVEDISNVFGNYFG